mgnify:CR=1 FL=1
MVGHKVLKGVPYYKGKTFHLEKGVKVQYVGANLDGKPRYVVNLPRKLVDQLDIKKGDIVCGYLWRKWYKNRDTGSRELYIASLVKEELDLIQQNGLTEKEETFCKSYRELMEAGNVSTAKYIEGQAYAEFGEFRTRAVLKSKNWQGIELAGELVLPEVADGFSKDSKSDTYMSSNGTIIEPVEDENDVQDNETAEPFSSNLIEDTAVHLENELEIQEPLSQFPLLINETLRESAVLEPEIVPCNYMKNGGQCSELALNVYCLVHLGKKCWDCKLQAVKDCKCSMPMCELHDHMEMH